MMRKLFIICLVVSFGFLHERAYTQSTKELPNILWISVEDISPDLGCYGNAQVKTPQLDQLALEGVRYTNAIATAPVCAPARSTIITGMYPTSLGSMHMRCKGRMPEGFSYYPQLLREKGYFCTNNKKEDYNLSIDSLQIWHASSDSAHWRNRKDDNQPFFSIFNLTLTHESCINRKEKHDRLTAELPEDLRVDPNDIDIPPYYPDNEIVRELWARHYDNIAMMDIIVGQLLQQLEEDGLSENTIVFFYSDHGTGTPRHKRWLYDSGVLVPLIVKAPPKFQHLIQGNPGTTNDELVSFIDLAPTVLNLADVEVPSNMQGRAFLGENLSPERAYTYSARDRMDERYDMQRSVRSKRYKYIRYYEANKPFTQYMNTPEKGAIMKAIREADLNGAMPEEGVHISAANKPAEELFDLWEDPLELNNLASDPNYQQTLLEMREAHARWSDKTKDAGLIPETIMRIWEEKYDRSIYHILREQSVPINEIREAALGSDFGKLSEALTHDNEAVRYWAAISIGNHPDYMDTDAVDEVLMELMNDQVPAVRIAAARARCKKTSDTKAISVLTQDLRHDNEWVRLLAAQVLDEMGEQARDASDILQQRIETDKNKYVVRVANHTLNALNGTHNEVP